MLRVYACIAHQHDPYLVALAGVVAVLGSYTALSLLRHIRALQGHARHLWLGGAALAAGSAIWATHFVAMLAFQQGIEVRYDIVLTALSLLAAVILTCLGFGIALLRSSRVNQASGGATVGLGIAAMHYTGMSALQFPGFLSWDAGLVATSLALGCGFGAASLPFALTGLGRWSKLAATVLLTLSICGLHFTGMAAGSITLTAVAALPTSVMSQHWLAINVAGACFILLLLSASAVQLGRRDRRQREVECLNLQSLADIAMEGLLVCDGDLVIAVNTSFEQMVGRPASSLVGSSVSALFEATQSAVGLPGSTGEHMLLSADGQQIPVEMMQKPILYSNRPHRVVAVRDLRERRKAEQETRFLAHHDALTSLANRPAFGLGLDRQMCEQSRTGEQFALLALDLDRFKEVNDTMGHGIGDLLLTRVAGRLRATLRETDLIARLGGDEFSILPIPPLMPAEAATLARQIVEMVCRPYILDGKIVNISASVGVAMAPQDGGNAVTLMRNADLALCRAKSDGRNTLRFFEQGMDMRMQHRRTLELELRHAITHEELEVFYQPLFDVAAQRVRGFEALVRWRHPQRGLIPPGDFITLAEETGLIVALGEHVLNTAVTQAAAWSDETTMAVNLSAVQFAAGGLVGTVKAALAQSRLPPHRLEFEITEGVLLKEGIDTLDTLHALRDLGVRISMDDFGTGYSSLRYLRVFPFDRIKIDRSFVQEMLVNAECAAIIWAVIGLGQRLGIATTAEGVETQEQMTHLQQQGCDVLQGYLIGRPMPAAEASRFVAVPVAEAA